MLGFLCGSKCGIHQNTHAEDWGFKNDENEASGLLDNGLRAMTFSNLGKLYLDNENRGIFLHKTYPPLHLQQLKSKEHSPYRQQLVPDLALSQ